MSHLIIIGDSRSLPIADKSVHCCVTSPPYWGLRDYGTADQIGLEPTIDEYIENMLRVFGEVWRVLRDDGTCWVNMGDAYCTGTKTDRGKTTTTGPNVPASWSTRNQSVRCGTPAGLKTKDLIGVPWRVAFALQEAGWYLRQDIIWHKPNGMVESVRDRCTKAHEYVFLLSKNKRYFYDTEAVKVPVAKGLPGRWFTNGATAQNHGDDGVDPEFRNLRSVWKISTHSFKGAHFATFPPKLASRCILAGTSAKGCCPACGAPWARIVERSRVATRPGDDTKIDGLDSNVVGNRDPLRHVAITRSLGWKPSCKCGREDVAPCVVLDPFNGAGTCGVSAVGSGRNYIGVEINPEYAAMADQRIARPHAPVVKASDAHQDMPLFCGAD